jgi:hypothetical protein
MWKWKVRIEFWSKLLLKSHNLHESLITMMKVVSRPTENCLSWRSNNDQSEQDKLKTTGYKIVSLFVSKRLLSEW